MLKWKNEQNARKLVGTRIKPRKYLRKSRTQKFSTIHVCIIPSYESNSIKLRPRDHISWLRLYTAVSDAQKI